MLLRISFDFTYPVTLDVTIKNFANDFGFLWYDLHSAI